MTRASGHCRRTSTAARSPSSVWLGGIRTSTTPTSGRCSSAAATNDGPSPTEATTSWPASASSSWRPSLSSSESSATTILIGRHAGIRAAGDGGSAGGRGDLERAVGGPHPLLEPGQAVALAGVGAAHAVVLDRAPRAAPPSCTTPTSTRVGAAVLGHVGERLGHHEVDGGLDVRRQAGRARRWSRRPGPRRGRTASCSAAARPRSTSSGGAIPRDSDRSSATVSRACCSAASMVSFACRGSWSSCLPARPRSMLSRTSRCCGPSWMSRSSRRSESASAIRAASRPPSTRRTSCWSSARLHSST